MKKYIRITYKPHEKALKTDFKIYPEDLKSFIEYLKKHADRLIAEMKLLEKEDE
jgi:hypothetical protein